MNRKFLLCLGLAAIALAYVLNVSHAIDNYGILKINLIKHVRAQQSDKSGCANCSGTGCEKECSCSGSSNGSSNGSNTETFQKGEKEITRETQVTNERGWTWDLKAGVWLFEGKATNKAPSYSWKDSEKIKINCCRSQGDLTDCKFEQC